MTVNDLGPDNWMIDFLPEALSRVYLVLINNNLLFLFEINFASKKDIDLYWEILKIILSLL
jgi:hypothetical protein